MLVYALVAPVMMSLISVTRHMVEHYVNLHISTQHRASVLLLPALLFVRGRVLSCPFMLAHDIDMLVDFICIYRLQNDL